MNELNVSKQNEINFLKNKIQILKKNPNADDNKDSVSKDDKKSLIDSESTNTKGEDKKKVKKKKKKDTKSSENQKSEEKDVKKEEKEEKKEEEKKEEKKEDDKKDEKKVVKKKKGTKKKNKENEKEKDIISTIQTLENEKNNSENNKNTESENLNKKQKGEKENEKEKESQKSEKDNEKKEKEMLVIENEQDTKSDIILNNELNYEKELEELKKLLSEYQTGQIISDNTKKEIELLKNDNFTQIELLKNKFEELNNINLNRIKEYEINIFNMSKELHRRDKNIRDCEKIIIKQENKIEELSSKMKGLNNKLLSNEYIMKNNESYSMQLINIINEQKIMIENVKSEKINELKEEITELQRQISTLKNELEIKHCVVTTIEKNYRHLQEKYINKAYNIRKQERENMIKQVQLLEKEKLDRDILSNKITKTHKKKKKNKSYQYLLKPNSLSIIKKPEKFGLPAINININNNIVEGKEQNKDKGKENENENEQNLEKLNQIMRKIIEDS